MYTSTMEILRKATTTVDIALFRNSHPVGSTIKVPEEIFFDNGKRSGWRRTIRDAVVLESYKRVVVTTAGTFQWKQCYFAAIGIPELG